MTGKTRRKKTQLGRKIGGILAKIDMKREDLESGAGITKYKMGKIMFEKRYDRIALERLMSFLDGHFTDEEKSLFMEGASSSVNRKYRIIEFRVKTDSWEEKVLNTFNAYLTSEVEKEGYGKRSLYLLLQLIGDRVSDGRPEANVTSVK